MADEPTEPWWLGTEYEILEPMWDDCHECYLEAHYLPANGIRIRIVDTTECDEDGVLGIACEFDFSSKQADLVGRKLIEWARRQGEPAKRHSPL